MGIALAILGILLTITFAFETPRKKIVGFFKKSPDLKQTLRIHTSFHAHNDGKPLGPIGANKTDKAYILNWEAFNKSDRVMQIESVMIMKQRKNQSVISLEVPDFTNQIQIIQNHKIQLLSLELTKGEVDHYRHWVKECDAFGVKETSGTIHWVDSNQFSQLSLDLNKIAEDYGLPDVVPEGKQIILQVTKNKTSNKSLN